MMKTLLALIGLSVFLHTAHGFNLLQLPSLPPQMLNPTPGQIIAPASDPASEPASDPTSVSPATQAPAPAPAPVPPTQAPGENSEEDPQNDSEESSDPLFESSVGEALPDFQLPPHLVKVNETKVVENLTSVEKELEELQNLHVSTVTLDGPSETEVAALTTEVDEYLTAITEVETVVNEFEQSILEFEQSRPINPPTVAPGLSDSDVASLTELTSTLGSISTSIQTMETLKESLASKLDEMTSKMASLPAVMSDAKAEQLHTKLDDLDSTLESQTSHYETVLEEFHKECDKVDQQVEMFPPSGNTGIVGEEKSLPVLYATQSSVKGDNTAYKATDNQKGYYWESWNSCSVTLDSYSGAWEEPWWMAEFSEVFGVSQIEIERESNYNLFPLKVEGILQTYSNGSLHGRKTCFEVFDNSITPQTPYIRECDTVVPARFIRLTITQPGATLALCEFKAKGYYNYSPYPSMDITLSSTESSYDKASFASDFQEHTCAMTMRGDLDPSPWLQIDMREQKTLTSVTLTSRGDDYGSYMRDLKVVVYTDLPSACGNTETTECAQFVGEHADFGGKLALVCSSPTKGRYIRVVKTTVPPEPLSICEFELEFEESN